jgi:hypothetical protein
MHSSPKKQMVGLHSHKNLAMVPFNYACIIHIYIDLGPSRVKGSNLKKHNLAYCHTSILGTINLEHICVLRESRIFSSINLLTYPGIMPMDARTFLPRRWCALLSVRPASARASYLSINKHKNHTGATISHFHSKVM